MLGPLTIDGTDAAAAGLGPRDRIVLAALVVSGDDALSVEQLAEVMWGERPPASWRKVLHGCVARLRRALGPQAVGTVPKGYRIGSGAEEIDARRFERRLGRARELITLGEPDRALFTLDEALTLWRGRALVDVEDWERGRIEASRLEELRLDAEELRVDAALRAGRHLEVLAEARARVAEAPLRERRWALLALAQYQAGRQGEALASLRRARTTLRTELGLDPGEDLIVVEQRILRHDPTLSIPDDLPAPSDRCPYLGLLAYDVHDAEAFFGREADVTACLHRLATVGALTVVGASGSGKSSLVRAGVAAALRREGRPVVVVTPGHRPTEALASVPGPGGVLVVDQCEEVFTLCEDPAERGRFLTAVADHADRGTLVVLAMRADRFGEVSAEPRFARLVERGLHMLAAMGEADLRSAIEEPAHQAGELLEPGLVDILVRDVAGEPGALPLLSHALRQTWQRREGRTLTVAGYRDTGGIRGAVANTAEEVYDQLPPAQRPLLRELMLRLVVPTPDGEPSRGRVPRRTVAAGPAQESMIERLVAARLVTSDEGVVELAHEAIARAWPRLRAWLDDDADGLRIRRHLSVAADAWDAMGRPDSETYRGARLARALDWRERGRSDLTPVENAFLDAARTLATAEQHRTVRENRRLRTLLAAAAVLLLIAGGAGVLAFRQASRATAAALAADARRIGAQAVATPQMDRAAAAGRAGRADGRRDRYPRQPARHGEPFPPAHRRHPLLPPGSPRLGCMSAPTGGRLIVLDGPRVGVYDTSSRAEKWEPPDVVALRYAGRVAVRSDGAQVALAYRINSSGWAVRLIDTPGLTMPSTQPESFASPTEAGDIVYGPDGRLFVASFSEVVGTDDRDLAIVRIWDAEAHALVARIEAPWEARAARFGPDRRLLFLVGTPPAEARGGPGPSGGLRPRPARDVPATGPAGPPARHEPGRSGARCRRSFDAAGARRRRSRPSRRTSCFSTPSTVGSWPA